MTNLKLIAEKIAVTELKEEITGSIILPENRSVTQEIGRVLAVGNGKYRTGEERQMFVKPGDIVMYQLGGPQVQNARYRVGGKDLKIFHQGDALARLKSTTVTLDAFEILGNWVLLKAEVEQSLIHVPEQHAPPEQIKFTVVQVGAGFDCPNIEIGTEVFPERGKVSPIEIEGVTYVYTLQDFIHGGLAEEGTGIDAEEPDDAAAVPEAQ